MYQVYIGHGSWSYVFYLATTTHHIAAGVRGQTETFPNLNRMLCYNWTDNIVRLAASTVDKKQSDLIYVPI